MADDVPFVVHDHPEPDPRNVGAQKAAEKFDGFVQGQGQILTPEEQQQKKIRRVTKEDLKRFVIDLIAELSRRTCEEHVEEIEGLKRAIALLESGNHMTKLKTDLDAQSEQIRNGFNATIESDRTAQQGELQAIRDAAEAEARERQRALEEELRRLQTACGEFEAKLAAARAQLEALQVEIAMLKELERQLTGANRLSKQELEKKIAEMKARLLELEAEQDAFAAVEAFDAEGFRARAEEIAAKADASHAALAGAVRDAAVRAGNAWSQFEALKQEMYEGKGSLWVVVEMLKQAHLCEGAQAEARMVERGQK